MFWLGTHEPAWLGRAGVPLFVAHPRLQRRPYRGRAIAPWALDSGGFTQVTQHGGWTIEPAAYADAVRGYQQTIGQLQWAAPQDWMVEDVALKATGLSVAEHQRRTVQSVLTLRDLAPDVPWVPVLQGWTPADYEACIGLYAQAGVDLAAEPVVGLGTVCRRQDTDAIGVLVSDLAAHGLRLHGFGVKLQGVAKYGHLLHSADSLAWSYGAYRGDGAAGLTCTHQRHQNCLQYALWWRRHLLRQTDQPRQLQLM